MNKLFKGLVLLLQQWIDNRADNKLADKWKVN